MSRPRRGVPGEERTMKASIYSLAFGGDGVGRVDGKVCFVKGALPGEEVIFNVVKDTDSYVKGDVKEIISASPDRVKPICKYYEKCGGCQLQHISYEKELFYKEQQLNELVSRIAGKKDVKCLPIMPSPKEYNYRSSVTMHSDGGPWGYFKADGINIMPIDECPIAEDAINAELKTIEPDGKDNVTIKADHEGKVWVSDRPGERFFTDKYGETELFVSPKGFTQANRHIAAAIADELSSWIGAVGPDTAFFDAYSGIGFFTFLVKGDFAARIGMDSSRIAIDCAKSTERKHSREDIKFYLGDAEEEFLALYERLSLGKNILLLDPPRQGLEKRFLEQLKAAERLNKVYYLSCDPARLARDIKIMTESHGWELGRIKPFDMFPRTKHIETLAEFVRR